MKTLGCDKNTVDSQSTAGLLVRKGHRLTGDAAGADVIMVNTCGFIQDAKQESIDTILALAAEKKAHQLLIVSGCLSQRYGEQLAKLIPADGADQDCGRMQQCLQLLQHSFHPGVLPQSKSVRDHQRS